VRLMLLLLGGLGVRVGLRRGVRLRVRVRVGMRRGVTTGLLFGIPPASPSIVRGGGGGGGGIFGRHIDRRITGPSLLVVLLLWVMLLVLVLVLVVVMLLLWLWLLGVLWRLLFGVMGLVFLTSSRCRCSLACLSTRIQNWRGGCLFLPS
jgi:hypothetical protein